MCSRPAYETYARLLMREGHGYPLWAPSPNEALPEEYRNTGIGVGDVGLVTEYGAFDFLFNIFLPADDITNRFHGVPEGFAPLSRHPSETHSDSQWHRPGVPISRSGTESVTFNAGASAQIPGVPALTLGAEIELRFNRSSGAVLMLPDGAERVNYQHHHSVREYAARNAQSWYNFVNGPLGRETKNGSLYLITGYDKTCAWELAAFSDPSQEISIKFTANGFSDGKLHMTRSSTMQSGVSSRCSTSTKNNQAVFIRGFKIRLRRGIKRLRSTSASVKYINDMSAEDVMYRGRIVSSSSSTSESHGIGGSGNTGATDSEESHSSHSSASSSSSYEDNPENSQVYCHPSDILNDYILDSCEGVEVAMTHDNVWNSIRPDTDLDKAELIRRVKERYEIRIGDPGYAYPFPRRKTKKDKKVEFFTKSIATTTRSRVQEPRSQKPALTTTTISDTRKRGAARKLDGKINGWIETTKDALLILEAARRGLITRVTRPLSFSDQYLITSGALFVYDEAESGITRWTDGYRWTHSHILGNFREQSLIVENSLDRNLLDGFVRRIFSLTIDGAAQHVVSYYRKEDVISNRRLMPVSLLPQLASLDISPEYLDEKNFRNPPKVKKGPDGVPRYLEEADEHESGYFDETRYIEE